MTSTIPLAEGPIVEATGVAGLARVVIGEGEKDDAPMLYAGEHPGLFVDGLVPFGER